MISSLNWNHSRWSGRGRTRCVLQNSGINRQKSNKWSFSCMIMKVYWFAIELPRKLMSTVTGTPRDVARGLSHPPPTFHTCRHFGTFHWGPNHGKKIKILWRRKCVRRGIFRNVEIRIEGRFVPFNPYFVCNTAIGSLCDDFYRKSYDFTIKNR